MNVKKTKVLHVCITIKVENANLEQVHQFKYLGTQITDDARTETELQCIMTMTKYMDTNT